MNLFDFLKYTFEFATVSFANFCAATFFITIVGILVIAGINAISNFRLFDINKMPEIKDDTSKNTSIYDMLVDAYDKNKNKGKK